MTFMKEKANNVLPNMANAEKSMNVLKAILANAAPDTWYADAPKIKSAWEPCDLCDLRGSDLSNQRIVEVMLAECALDGADFSNSLLEKTMLQAATASDAKFQNAKLHLTQMIPFYGERVNFTGALFEQAAMSYSKLLESSFASATLNKVTLSHADLTASSFAGTRSESSNFSASKMSGADLSRAIFFNCDLHWTVFHNAQMRGTILEGCDMRGTDFRGACLDGATIRGGKFGVVQQGDEFTPTRFDDTPQARKLVAESQAEGTESIEWMPVNTAVKTGSQKVMAGDPCPSNGFWFTPAQAGSRRHFTAGQIMPEIKSDYGTTIWQWDTNQNPPQI